MNDLIDFGSFCQRNDSPVNIAAPKFHEVAPLVTTAASDNLVERDSYQFELKDLCVLRWHEVFIQYPGIDGTLEQRYRFLVAEVGNEFSLAATPV